MGFKFNFELFFNIPILVLFATCKGISNFVIEVGQSKFTLWKMMSRRIFGEFMGFFFKGLNPFKIQAIFKLEIPLQFIIREPELIPTTKDVPSQFIYHHAKDGNFCSSGNTFFIICKFESIWELENLRAIRKGEMDLAHWSGTSPTG
jgi:hypothetical protein